MDPFCLSLPARAPCPPAFEECFVDMSDMTRRKALPGITHTMPRFFFSQKTVVFWGLGNYDRASLTEQQHCKLQCK